MSRLYPRNPDTSSVAANGQTFEINDDGYFDFPDELSDLLHGIQGSGNVWEDAGERSVRLDKEREDYLSSPRALHDLFSGATPPVAAADNTSTPTVGQTPAPTPAELREQARKLIEAADEADPEGAKVQRDPADLSNPNGEAVGAKTEDHLELDDLGKQAEESVEKAGGDDASTKAETDAGNAAKPSTRKKPSGASE